MERSAQAHTANTKHAYSHVLGPTVATLASAFIRSRMQFIVHISRSWRAWLIRCPGNSRLVLTFTAFLQPTTALAQNNVFFISTFSQYVSFLLTSWVKFFVCV